MSYNVTWTQESPGFQSRCPRVYLIVQESFSKDCPRFELTEDGKLIRATTHRRHAVESPLTDAQLTFVTQGVPVEFLCAHQPCNWLKPGEFGYEQDANGAWRLWEEF